MRDRSAGRAAALLLAAALALAAGCGAGSNGNQPVNTTAPPERPQVTAAPGKVEPPAASNFLGYSIRLEPARGSAVILQEPAAAQLIMGAFSSERLLVKDAVGKFGNKVELIDPGGVPRYAFDLSSDGHMLLRYAGGDGRIFRMPEYIYYLMENVLWSYGGSLMDAPVKWQPAKGTSMLELELPRLLKAAMLPAYGYAMAYFATYKIYGVDTSVRNTAKVYLLITYAGYDIAGANFSPNFIVTTPVTLIFKTTGGDYWQLTALLQPPKTERKKDLYSNVRTIFPYAYMDPVMVDLADASFQVGDIVRLATEYLHSAGISGLNVIG
jgi:hypothetical protein